MLIIIYILILVAEKVGVDVDGIGWDVVGDTVGDGVGGIDIMFISYNVTLTICFDQQILYPFDTI